MKRSMDAERLNELANHPDIRPWLLGPDGPLDLSPLVLNPAVVVLEAEHGAFLLVPILPTVYELHTLFLKAGRGKAFFGHAADMFRYVFTRTPCLEIVTKVPDGNRGAAFASIHAGFVERFHRAGISFRHLTIERWALSAEACLEEGERFHAVMEEAGALSHAEDPVHDQIVGAALLMAHAGQLEKGATFYNGWASFSGYANIALAGPNLVDVRDAIIEVRDGRVGVLRCQSAALLQQRESAVH